MPSDALANMNFKTLGAKMPVTSLPDGRKVQTGTTGALLVNIKTYHKLVATTVSGGAQPEEQQRKQIDELEKKFKAAFPLMKTAGCSMCSSLRSGLGTRLVWVGRELGVGSGAGAGGCWFHVGWRRRDLRAGSQG